CSSDLVARWGDARVPAADGSDSGRLGLREDRWAARPNVRLVVGGDAGRDQRRHAAVHRARTRRHVAGHVRVIVGDLPLAESLARADPWRHRADVEHQLYTRTVRLFLRDLP